jgi:hypothetical protein
MTFKEYFREDHFKVGSKVKCKKSGKTGTVVSSTGSGDDEIYTIDFDGEEMEKKPNQLEQE